MRPRTKLLLFGGGVALLVVLAGLRGRRDRGTTSGDARTSTFLSGPNGSAAVWDALQRVGVEMFRLRSRPSAWSLDVSEVAGDGGIGALVVMNPVVAVTPAQATTILEQVADDPALDLVLVGAGTGNLMACFGYHARELGGGQKEVIGWHRVAEPGVTLATVLEATGDSTVADSSRAEDTGVMTCDVPVMEAVDTLLRDGAWRPIAIDLTREDDGSHVILIADEALVRNRALRETGAGPFLLDLLGSYDVIWFDEYHQGFGPSGSLARVVWAWSWRSPWGWAIWQVTGVGLLALLLAGIRFGPPRPLPGRRRRSPLEHVRALATALRATQGRDVAINLLLGGLKRRLGHTARRADDQTAWLDRLAHRAGGPAPNALVDRLQDLTRPGQPAESVARVANTVEDLWETLPRR